MSHLHNTAPRRSRLSIAIAAMAEDQDARDEFFRDFDLFLDTVRLVNPEMWARNNAIQARETERQAEMLQERQRESEAMAGQNLANAHTLDESRVFTEEQGDIASDATSTINACSNLMAYDETMLDEGVDARKTFLAFVNKNGWCPFCPVHRVGLSSGEGLIGVYDLADDDLYWQGYGGHLEAEHEAELRDMEDGILPPFISDIANLRPTDELIAFMREEWRQVLEMDYPKIVVTQETLEAIVRNGLW